MSRDMTVGQLIEYLGDVDPETPIRLAFQPSWPLQYHISDDIRVVRGTCYLAEGGQVYDTPYAPRAVFGEGGPEDACSNCERTNPTGTVQAGPNPERDREFICAECLKDVGADVRETFRKIEEKERSYSVR